MSRKQARFRPGDVPLANFGMFADKFKVVAEPAATMAQQIPDPTIAAFFPALAKKSLQVRVRTFEELIQTIPTVQNEQVFEKMIGPCCIVFDDAVSDYHWETRKLAVEMMNALTLKMEKSDFSKRAKTIIPPLVFHVFDTNPDVSESARVFLKRYIETPEKQMQMFSMLAEEIGRKVRSMIDELEKSDWGLGEAEKTENWGRICSECLVVANYLLKSRNFSSGVFERVGTIPILNWLKLTKGQFDPKMAPQARAYAYVFLLFSLQNPAFSLPSELVYGFLKAENSVTGQDKLLKLVTVLRNKKLVEDEKLMDVLLEALPLYYQPEKVQLGKLLREFGNKSFIEKCIGKVVTIRDLTTANELFKCVIDAMPEAISQDQLLDLFKKAVSRDPPSTFFAECSLEPFLRLKDDSRMAAILDSGDEARVFTFLSLTGEGAGEWLKRCKEITARTLAKIVKSSGAAPIRNAWPTLKDIPITGNEEQPLVDFIRWYARSDEIPFVVERWPNCLPRLLSSWTGDFSCFKCQKLLDMSSDLLDKDMNLVRFLFYIFPENAEITALIDTKVKNHLLKDAQFDPSICDYFKPSNDLLDAVLFSGGVEVVQEGDSIVKCLTRRITEIAGTAKPGPLAQAAIALVENANVDPAEIAVSPLDEPAFAYEFWFRIGFDKMNGNDFCFLLNSYINYTMPWIQSELYVHAQDWKQLPSQLITFVRRHKEFATIAHEARLTVALSCICSLCNLRLSFFEDKINGIALCALSDERPAVSLETDNLAKVISADWNERVPDYPDFSLTGENELRLRQAIAYAQHYLPVCQDFTDFIALVNETITSDDQQVFFLTLRLLSLLYEANCHFDVEKIMKIITDQIVKFERFPPAIERELASAFRIGRFMTPNQFEPFVLSLVDQFNTKASVFLAHQIVPLISFFNRWDLIESRFGHKLKLDNVAPWHLITTALPSMPYQKRLDIVQDFVALLPPLLDSLRPHDPDFLMLISAFPAAAMRWFTKLHHSKSKPLMVEMDKGGTETVFKNIVNSIAGLSLQCTTITPDMRNRAIHAEYVEDESSIPVKLDLTFPKGYPFCHVKVRCEFGTEGDTCAHNVAGAIIGHNSIEAGIKTWHQFVTYRLVDADPCTVCYSYISEDGKCPTIACQTCGNKFHGKCLSTWFSKCLKPTCPYCASAWQEKKKKK